MENEEKKYKAKHHAATGPFSFVEIEVEESMKVIAAQAHWLNRQFKGEEK